MSTISNEAQLRGLIDEFWNARKLDTFEKYFTPDAVLHSGKTDYSGNEGFREGYVAGFMKAFPDLHHEIEFLVVDGDLAAMRFHGTGTLQEEYRGLRGAGQRLDYHGTAFFRMTGGRIAEVWSHSDLWEWVAGQ